MKFRTEINIPAAPFTLDVERPVVLLGSCFSVNIGRRIERSRWNAVVNPGGVLFNPASIALQLRLALHYAGSPEMVRKEIERTVFLKEDIYCSWLFDSSICSISYEECLEKAQRAIEKLHEGLREADALIITFGTSIIYGRKDGGGVVANCHKMSGGMFERRMMSQVEIVGIYSEIIERLRDVNPTLKIIFTVSPVRHVKDGLHVNQLSKATLLFAIESLTKSAEAADYFPAYEIMLDDLRDYRFYAADMVHPSDVAVEYIWDKFQSAYLTESARKRVVAGERLTARLEHRHIIPDSAAAHRFDAETARLLSSTKPGT